MVSDKDPAGFTVEANVIVSAFLVLGLGTREGEVDGETLKWLLSRLDRTRTGWFLALFGLDAGRALFEDGFMMLELRDTFDVAMGIVKVVVTRMTKALMPKKTFGGSADGIDRRGVLYDTMER